MCIVLHLSYDLKVPLFSHLAKRNGDICAQKRQYYNFQGNLIYNTAKGETIQMHFSSTMDKHIVVCSYNEIMLRDKKQKQRATVYTTK